MGGGVRRGAAGCALVGAAGMVALFVGSGCTTRAGCRGASPAGRVAALAGAAANAGTGLAGTNAGPLRSVYGSAAGSDRMAAARAPVRSAATAHDPVGSVAGELSDFLGLPAGADLSPLLSFTLPRLVRGARRLDR